MHPEPLSVAKVTGGGGQVWWWEGLPQRWGDPTEASAHATLSTSVSSRGWLSDKGLGL